MIGLSLYLVGSKASLTQLATGLQILPQNCLEQGNHASDFSFYDREENALFFSPIKGDFDYACDIDLFHVTKPQLHASLVALSAQGLVIGTPDDDSGSPFAFLLYEGGKTALVEIMTDEITENVCIRHPLSGKV